MRGTDNGDTAREEKLIRGISRSNEGSTAGDLGLEYSVKVKGTLLAIDGSRRGTLLVMEGFKKRDERGTPCESKLKTEHQQEGEENIQRDEGTF